MDAEVTRHAPRAAHRAALVISSTTDCYGLGKSMIVGTVRCGTVVVVVGEGMSGVPEPPPWSPTMGGVSDAPDEGDDDDPAPDAGVETDCFA
jgi:hypothetical protein